MSQIGKMEGGSSGSRLAGRIALITGASRGLGRALALRYAGEGATVVAVARTQGALEELDDEIRAIGGAASLVPCDLTDHSTIDRIGAAIFERWGRLDVFVGNAGILGDLTPLAHLRPEVWDAVCAVNVTANWRLIRSLDPLLRASAAGRAIFVTCSVGRDIAYWGPYATSKAALEAMVRIYAAEVRKTSLRVNLVDPGAMRTGLRAQAFPGEDPATVRLPEDASGLFVDLADAGCTRHGELITA